MRFLTSLAITLGLFAVGSPAFAHHVMDGQLPATFGQGLLSGLAHPVIGLDHLLVIVAVGLLSLGSARGAWLAAGFVGASVIGTGLHLLRVDVPAFEVLVACTVVVFGILVLALRRTGEAGALGWLAPIAIGAGALHGYAFGEAIVGAGATPLVAYLLGFCAIQAGVVLAVRRLAQLTAGHGLASARLRAVFGGATSLAGATLMVLALRG